MTKTKIILVVLTLSLVTLALVGIAYAQFANTKNQNSIYNQTPLDYTGNNGYLPPNAANGYNGYTQYSQQGTYPFRMGMMGVHYW